MPILYLLACLLIPRLSLNAQDSVVKLLPVQNQVRIGSLAGNRKLEFGVKNIVEELLLDRNFELRPDASTHIQVDIVFLDVLTTKKNVSFVHGRSEAVVIRLRGTLIRNGKAGKPVVVEESSAETSMATLVIDEGGGFNQQSLSNALKKAAEALIISLMG